MAIPKKRAPIRVPLLVRRWLAALVIGISAGILTALIQGTDNGFVDIWLAHGSAADWLRGVDPYGYPTGGWPSNPLPAILLMTPFAPLPLPVAASLFMGISSGLMAFGLTAEGTWWRLWAFASFPFLFSLIVVQWSPLMFAVLLLPALYPLWLVKPQIGFAAAIFNFSWRRLLAAALVLALSFLLLPDWPIRWLRQIGGYDGFFPILILPGPILLFALIHRKTREGLFLLLYSLLPQRLWYDQLLLWWIPRSRRSMLLMNVSSWAIGTAYFAFHFGWIGQVPRPASREAVLWSMFIPALLILFLDQKTRGEKPRLVLSEPPAS